jgi:4-hydroxybutyrate dehydrogenase/sulfolactaldehyde 3-reductase
MKESAMQQIGFIGLGRMGSPMASNLCRKGFKLQIYDVNPQAVASFGTTNSAPAKSIADIARSCDIVITMLPGSAQVEEVVLGFEGLLAHGRAGQLILDMSTIDPTTTDLLAKRASAKGISVVDAPVGRLASHADRGESLFMVGASAQDFERVLPLLQAMGTTIHHCGKVGAGMRTKLVNNYLAIVSCQLNAEALALSQRFGLDLEKTLEVINGTSAFNGQLRMNWSTKVLKGDISAGFTIDLAHKDLSLIMDAANQAKVPLPVAAATREMFSMARAGRYAQSDFSAMIDVLCDFAGIAKPRLAAPDAQATAPRG